MASKVSLYLTTIHFRAETFSSFLGCFAFINDKVKKGRFVSRGRHPRQGPRDPALPIPVPCRSLVEYARIYFSNVKINAKIMERKCQVGYKVCLNSVFQLCLIDCALAEKLELPYYKTSIYLKNANFKMDRITAKPCSHQIQAQVLKHMVWIIRDSFTYQNENYN